MNHTFAKDLFLILLTLLSIYFIGVTLVVLIPVDYLSIFIITYFLYCMTVLPDN